MEDTRIEVADDYVGTDEIDSLWNLAEDFSIVDAAALVAGCNPTRVEGHKPENRNSAFPGYPVALKALTHAITNGRLKSAIRHSAREYGYADAIADQDYGDAVGGTAFGSTSEEDESLSNDHSCFYKSFPDWKLSTVSRDDLTAWLANRGVKTGFFFSTATDAPDYLDPKNPRYAHKLAAAVRAWQAVTDPKGKHPKQALAKWLRENAVKFGLTDEEGKPNETGIEEAAKVANWQPGGGAPKTSGE
jgi:hypothetical protein